LYIASVHLSPFKSILNPNPWIAYLQDLPQRTGNTPNYILRPAGQSQTINDKPDNFKIPNPRKSHPRKKGGNRKIPYGLWRTSSGARRLRGESPSACRAPNSRPILKTFIPTLQSHTSSIRRSTLEICPNSNLFSDCEKATQSIFHAHKSFTKLIFGRSGIRDRPSQVAFCSTCGRCKSEKYKKKWGKKRHKSPWFGREHVARGSSGLKPLRRCAPIRACVERGSELVSTYPEIL